MGYHLTLVKGRSCDTGRLSELIKSTVPGSQLASDVSAELTFLLPFTSSQHFPTLLDTLESKYSPPLSSFSLSLVSLPLSSLLSLLDFFQVLYFLLCLVLSRLPPFFISFSIPSLPTIILLPRRNIKELLFLPPVSCHFAFFFFGLKAMVLLSP